VASPGSVAHPVTVSGLEEMPDDGRRYELVDGTASQPFPVRVVPADLERGPRP